MRALELACPVAAMRARSRSSEVGTLGQERERQLLRLDVLREFVAEARHDRGPATLGKVLRLIGGES